MEAYQIDLLIKVCQLLFILVGSASVSAYIFRNTLSWSFLIGSFVAAIILIFVAVGAGKTGNPLLVFPVMAMFGAAIGSTLGSFTLAVTDGKERGRDAVIITLAIIAISMLATATIGLLSGFNFQGIGGIMFVILLGIVAISMIGIFVHFGKVTEMVIGLGVSLFFMVYMIYDFNKVIFLYNESTWGAAVDISMNLFLDMVNIFVRLLPIIAEILD